MKPKKIRPTHCNYCDKPIHASFEYVGYISGNGRLNGRAVRPIITVAACKEHEGCVNWTSVLASHPEAVVKHAA